MKLLPLIIFFVIVVNVLRRIAEYNRNRPPTDEGWDDLTPPGEGPGQRTRGPTRRGPVPAPGPEDALRRALEEWVRQQGAPPAPPPLPGTSLEGEEPEAPEPPPLPAPMAAAPAPRRTFAPAGGLPPGLGETSAEPLPQATPEPESAAPRLEPAFDGARVFRESLAKAFPPAAISGRELQSSRHRAPYVLRLRGRRSLRQAIVLMEALGPPRAFDV